jgi:hypothetical protein
MNSKEFFKRKQGEVIKTESSQYLKELLQLDHQLPVGFLQIVSEIFLAGVDGFSANLNSSNKQT